MTQKRCQIMSPTTSPKRAKMLHGRCSLVENAVKGVPDEQLSKSMKVLLVAGIPCCLGVAKNKRHPFQEALVAQIQDALEGTRTRLEASAAAAQAKLDGCSEDKRKRDQTAAATRNALPQLEVAVSDSKAAAVEASNCAKAAEKTSRETQAAKRKDDQDVAATEADKNRISELMKVATSEDNPLSRSEQKALLDLARKLNVDSALLNILPSVFKKKPADYGHFDTVSFTHLQEKVSAHLADISKKLEDGAPCRAERAAAAEAAEKEFEAALATKEARAAGVVEARNTLAAGTQAAKQAKTAVDRFLHDLKGEADSLDRAKAAMAHHADVYAVFTALRDHESESHPAEAPAAKAVETPAAVVV